MLRRLAPTAEPMWTKSPSLVGAAQPPKTGAAQVVLAQLDVVGEAAGGEDHRLARLEALTVLPSALSASTPTTRAVVVDDDALDAMAGADVDAGSSAPPPPSCGRRCTPPSDIVVARLLGDEHAAGRRLVLGQLRPVVGHAGAVAVFERALLGEELGRRRGVVVDRRAGVVFPLRSCRSVGWFGS